MSAFMKAGLPREHRSIKKDITGVSQGFRVSGLLLSKFSKNDKDSSFVFAIHLKHLRLSSKFRIEFMIIRV